MEFTAWEDSQHRNPTDFVDPWDSNRPFEPDSFVAYDELDPHDAGPPPHKTLDDEFSDLRRNDGDHSFYFDDPSIHVPVGLAQPEFVGPGDLHDSAREPSAFDDGDHGGRGHKRELSEAFTMRYPLVSPSHGAPYGHAVPTVLEGGDTSPDLTANMMRTPVRAFSSYSFDGTRAHGSPSYAAGGGLESPLESLALQSPYMAGQPFPALPRVQEHQGPEAQRVYTSKSPRNKDRQLKQQQQQQQQQRQRQQQQQQQQQQQEQEQQEQQQEQQEQQEETQEAQENYICDSPQVGPDSGTASKAERKAAADNYTPTRRSLSSSGSLSSNLSAVSAPQAEEVGLSASAAPASAASNTPSNTTVNAAETTPDRGPTTPRASSSRTASRRTPASVTPRAGEAGRASASTSTPTPGQDGRRDSRKRIAKDQIEILEAFFHRNPRPEREDRMRLSTETGLEPRTVQIWFQNRRAKSRSMKMPPSQADNSVFAQQYRAAAAAASNAAAAAAGSQPMVPMGPQGPVPMDRTPSQSDAWTLTPNQQRMMVSPAGSRHTPGYGVFQPQQRVYTGHGSPPPHGQSMGRYHQQLGAGKPMYPMGSQGPQGLQGMQGMQGAPPGMQFHNMQQPMHHHPMHTVQGMVPNGGPGPQLMPAMPPPRMGQHGRSMSAYEPFVAGYGPGPPECDADGCPVDGPLMYGSKGGSTASLTSIGSSYGLPQSPLNSELLMDGPPVYSPSMQSLQNSPDMNSPVTSFPAFGAGRPPSMSEEPVQLSRSQSAHSFGDAWSRGPAPPMGEMKRRRSLYGAVPTWGWADHNAGPYVHASPPRTPSLSSNSSSAGSNAGTLAASAAAAALRTRNRSSTQPAPRSRQPSIRLQLDESNHSATLVVLPQETESPRSGGAADGGERMTPRNSSERLNAGREISPERAERAAERLLAERAAAATMGSRPSTRQGDR